MKTKWKTENVWRFCPNDKQRAESFLLENDLSIAKKRLAENRSLISKCDLRNDDVTYDLNSYGFRCDDFVDISDDESLVVFVGCSFTFGSAVRKQDTWAFKAHQEIERQSGKKIRYLNLGWPGTGLDYFARILLNFTSHFNFKKLDGIFCLCPSVRRFEIPLSINTSPNIFAHHFPNININDDNLELMHIAKAKNELMQNDNFCLNEAVKSINLIKLIAQNMNCDNYAFGFMESENDRSVVDALVDATSLSGNILEECRYDLANDVGIDYLHPGPRWHSQFVSANLEKFK